MGREKALKADIERFANDPVFDRVVEAFQRFKLSQISTFENDGGPDAQDQLLEWCRELKVITNLSRTIKNDLSKLSERDGE